MPSDCPRCCGLNPKRITRPSPNGASKSAAFCRIRFSPSSQPLINGLNSGYVAIIFAPPRSPSKTGPDLKNIAISLSNPCPIGCFVFIRTRSNEPGQKNASSFGWLFFSTTLTIPFSPSPKYFKGSSVARFKQISVPPSSTNVRKFANPFSTDATGIFWR